MVTAWRAGGQPLRREGVGRLHAGGVAGDSGQEFVPAKGEGAQRLLGSDGGCPQPPMSQAAGSKKFIAIVAPRQSVPDLNPVRLHVAVICWEGKLWECRLLNTASATSSRWRVPLAFGIQAHADVAENRRPVASS